MFLHPLAVHFQAHCMFTRLSILAGLCHIPSIGSDGLAMNG